ncbi:YitT family protein [Halalkalibacterium ligniniphilum]|uniref:YitT family protein n=1 Tax=Halalkalibacterium ligniniphilum TaxID=1134413 RepID=UPI00047810BD|nr:YitT family protein [Halalkalibacterium ligniniphilum]
MRDSFQTYSLVICGGMLQGLAMALFLFPHSIPSGGAGGITVLLNFWFNIPLGFALWIVNFSLLVIAVKWLGNASAIGTMVAISVTSFSIYFFEDKMYMPTGNVWVDLLIGSFILGCGVGLLLRQDVSNGGMGVIALIIAKHRQIPPGQPLLVINGSIFVITASMIDWQIVIQALISQWIATRVVNVIYNMKIVQTKTLSVGWRKK